MVILIDVTVCFILNHTIGHFCFKTSHFLSTKISEGDFPPPSCLPSGPAFKVSRRYPREVLGFFSDICFKIVDHVQVLLH